MADLVTKAAELRDRVTIQHYIENQSQTTGELTYDDSAWATEAETWGDVQTLSGRDYVLAQQSGYVASHRARLRYRVGINIKTTRFIVKGVKLYVVHVNNEGGRNARLECLCRSAETMGV